MGNSELCLVDFTGKALDESDIDQCKEKLRGLVLDDNKLNKLRSDDGYLLRFLHCTNFDVLMAYKKMQDYGQVQMQYPDWFPSSSSLEKNLQVQSNHTAILKGRDKNGGPILVLRIGNINVSETSPQILCQLFDICIESFIEETENMFAGISIIIDTEGYSWKLFQWVTPSNVKAAVRKVDLYPLKHVVMHVVNTSFLVRTTIKFVWPFISEKIKEMIKFHFDDWSSLHEHIDPEVLPFEYGGIGPDIDFEQYRQFVLSQEPIIKKRLECNETVDTKLT